MSEEKKFVDGLIVKAPRDQAPDFVKMAISIKREELIAWLQKENDEWINIDVNEGRSGKWYCAVNTWKPQGGQSGGGGSYTKAQTFDSPGQDDDNIPFAPCVI